MADASTSAKQSIVSFSDARRIVEAHAAECLRHLPDAQEVALPQALGRVLAQQVRADRDLPPFDRSTRDGYAVRSADVLRAGAELRVVGEVRAGGEFPEGFKELRSGEALKIMTGAPLPQGADAVIMHEYTRARGDALVVERNVVAGENVVPRGSEAPQGAALLERGRRITPAEIALAAAVGTSRVQVFRKPRVAILSTGDEVIPLDQTPRENQIRNSNSYALAAQVAIAGGEPVQLPIAPDERARLRELLAQGLETDLLLITGGVSAGDYDLVEPLLEEFSAEFFFTGAQMQPGKPVVFGRGRARSGKQTYFVGLPGNPLSTMTCFELFAAAIVDALGGAPPRPLRFAHAHLAAALKTKSGLTRFLPAHLTSDAERSTVKLVPWQGSGDMVAFAAANCYVVLPPERTEFQAGELITVLLRG